MMKKICFLMAMSLLCIRAMAQDELPQWAQELVSKNPDVIESIQPVITSQTGFDTRTYVIYYHQPLNHSNPLSPTFPLRATITVFNDADVTTAVNQVGIGGYALPEWWLEDPDETFATQRTYLYHTRRENVQHGRDAGIPS